MSIIPIPGFSEPFSSWTHLLAAGASFVGLFYLCYRGWGNSLRLFSLSVFSFSLVFLFSMSGVYHLLDPAFVPRMVFQRLDHAAIWVLIAGTFTPTHLILFRGIWRWGILALVWIIGITGLVLEAVFFEDIPYWMSLTLYLGLGWMGLLTAWHFRKVFHDKSFHHLWKGGLAYSIGAILQHFDWPIIIEGVIGPHEIFHLLVITGAFYHWLFIYRWCHYPTKNTVMFHVSVMPNNLYIARAVGDSIRLEASSEELLKEKIRDHIETIFGVSRYQAMVKLKYFNEEILE